MQIIIYIVVVIFFLWIVKIFKPNSNVHHKGTTNSCRELREDINQRIKK